ncbi:hypothetical protein HMI54_004326 [Coelomomyces lativittatus]|nr:hypothetical protein HMI56_001829 [Coelomomyces lativittatus]KAJ1506843.1 hypothetical protein HMI55_001008 [Coelomomyces lativittatus]KAJ1507279.1 hypothetical protein HMI54_004326 [Coelomomyces lativittatus]
MKKRKFIQHSSSSSSKPHFKEEKENYYSSTDEDDDALDNNESDVDLDEIHSEEDENEDIEVLPIEVTSSESESEPDSGTEFSSAYRKDEKESKGWGHQRNYYQGEDTSDEEMAKMEEKEAKVLQQQRLQSLQPLDFLDDAFQQTLTLATQPSSLSTTNVSTPSSLTEENLSLVLNYASTFEDVKDVLDPLLRLSLAHLPSSRLHSYLKFKYTVYIGYLLNLAFFLAHSLNLKQTLPSSSLSKHASHPVVAHLIKYQKTMNLLNQMEKKSTWISDALEPLVTTLETMDLEELANLPFTLSKKQQQEELKNSTSSSSTLSSKKRKRRSKRKNKPPTETSPPLSMSSNASTSPSTKKKQVHFMPGFVQSVHQPILPSPSSSSVLLNPTSYEPTYQDQKKKFTHLSKKLPLDFIPKLEDEDMDERTELNDLEASYLFHSSSKTHPSLSLLPSSQPIKKKPLRKVIQSLVRSSKPRTPVTSADALFSSSISTSSKSKRSSTLTSIHEEDNALFVDKEENVEEKKEKKKGKEEKNHTVSALSTHTKKKTSQQGSSSTTLGSSLSPPLLEDATTTFSRRKVNTTILKNRGLTPYRKKQSRNPRIKHRNKYEAKMKKLKSFQRIVKPPSHAYGGEFTGIKTHLVRSTKLN